MQTIFRFEHKGEWIEANYQQKISEIHRNTWRNRRQSRDNFLVFFFMYKFYRDHQFEKFKREGVFEAVSDKEITSYIGQAQEKQRDRKNESEN